eukprot:5660952-Prymnesium_polylepis.1
MSARNTTPPTNQSARAHEPTSATPTLLPRDCGVEVELSRWCKASADAPCNAPPVSPNLSEGCGRTLSPCSMEAR